MQKILPIALLCPLLAAGGPLPATIEVDVAGLRDTRGMIQACMTQSRAHFPDCRNDPRAVRVSVPAGSRSLRFTGVAPGRYAITLFHDRNANQKLDKMMGVPREGFGFSRNPKIRFGAPRFDSVDIEIPNGFSRTSVRMLYLL